ncbi:hypothetical protein HXX76_002623 [Chlamydomonas incerta]|uniref:Uncharacterized protein n=1 Tax=Chlamydomonas incerta TaxID=51695 RepID=A0A835TBQ4_CHLIN|nr:hypothetical protein HXX76_002623 [Chlamydomonas incerta]|eukprot:KAG2442537.1 hypothetical protein HXX76_002623 [Chlamydomonas incerta]
MLRTSLSSPPPMSGLSMDEEAAVASAAPAQNAAVRPRRQPAAGQSLLAQAQAQSQAARARARTPPRASPPGVSPRQHSASTTGVSPSLSPSSVGASFRPDLSNPGTPSSVATSSHLASVAAGLTPRDGAAQASARARAIAGSSVESSPALGRGLGLGGGGGYAVYDAEAGGISGVIGYDTTPESQAGAAAAQLRRAHAAASASASSVSTSPARSAWTTPREGLPAAAAAAGGGPAGASPSAATPSSVVTSALTASAMSSALAMHNEPSARLRAGGPHARARVGDEDTVSDEEGLPHPLALAGRAFDGIDSEEDDDDDGVEDAVSRPERTAAAAAALQSTHGRGGRQPAASGEYAASFNFAAAGHAEASRPTSSRAPVPGQPGSRPALVAASLETEEALRALLCSPRLAPAPVSGGLSSSLDGGVPDDVLAALAKTDAGGLDAALGAAVATLVRQHAASLGVHGPAIGAGGPSAGRPSTQGQGASLGSYASPGGAAAAAAPMRHAALMGPGALTAAPAALPPGVAARGFDSSLRSAGGAPGASPGGGAVAANAGRGLAPHGAAPAVDASISLDQIDQLARTMVIDADTAALMRASVVAAATAMAEQRAAAAAHQQPVLYSMGPTRVSDPGSQAAAEPAAAGANAGGRPGTSARGPLSPSAASSVGKPGGEGDSVLYGSPNRRGAAAAAVPADGQVPPSIAPSPYVPPSPPPGADPSPYMASPIGHPISRLQHNSREDEEPVAAVKAKPGANRPAGGSEDGGAASGLTVSVGAAAMAGAAARGGVGSASTPTGGPDGTHRRQSNTASGASYDLSLTAAAAVGASRTGSASASRAAGGAAPRAAPLSHAATPTGGAQPGQPLFSSFSLAGLSPTAANAAAAAGAQGARAGAMMSSFDLGIDEAGKPSSPAASPRPGPSGASDSALGTSAARTSAQAQPPVAGPPLASFSRAAAMAAAADVGLVAPPAAAERRPSQGGVSAAAGHSSASMEAAARASAAGAGAGGSREPGAAGQNAVGGSSVASSAAKLSQLKARRQQQWQSQHAVNASTVADSHQQPNGTPQPTGANAARASAVNHAAADAGASHQHTPHAPANIRNRAPAEPTSAAAGAVRGSAASPVPAPAPAAAASPTPLLPEEVANAIVRAASSGVAASGELNLGHGISGLSVAIEAGAVKWAWQTGLKDGGGSPGASQASPWASPGAGQAAAAAALGAAAGGAGGKSGGESGEWGVQLPTPQWQRRGVTPPGSRPAADGADGADPELARLEQEALQQRQQQWAAEQQLWAAELPGPQYRAPAGAPPTEAQQQQQRRHTDHSIAVAESAAVASLAQPTREYATSAGGDAGLRPAGLSADSAGAASSKTAALLRLKRQSILRHCLAGSQARDGEQAEFEPEPEASVAASIQGTNSQRSSRAVSAPIHRASQRAQHQHQPDGAPRVAYSRAWEQPEPVPEGDEADGGEDAGGNLGPAPKPFLRRRSAKVQPKKVDWTHVKPRTNSRNPDYYGDQQEAYGAQYVPQYAQQYAAQLLQQKHVQHQQRISPRGGAGAGSGNADMQAILRQQPQPQAHAQRSPMTSPRGGGGGAAKPPLNVNVGSRAWKPSGKSPTGEDDRAPAAGRRRSNIPPAPAYGDGGNLGVGAGGGRVAGVHAGGAGGGPRGAPGANPLDDLLQHVNTLLKDFDKMVR